MDLLPGHVGGAVLFAVAFGDPALFGDEDLAEPDRDQVAVRLRAGLADRHDDTAPVRILPGDGRLDERRIGNGEADAASGAGGGRPGDANGDELFCPLAIAHDLLRKVHHQILKLAREVPDPWMARILHRLVPRLAGRGDEDGVGRRGVAVHRDAVERTIHSAADEPPQGRRGDGRIGEDEGQHGRHVRSDHAGALCDSVEGHRQPADSGRPRRALREGVGGHDGGGGVLPRAGRERPDDLRQCVRDPLGRKRNPDHAGRGDEHLRFRAPEHSGGSLHGPPHGHVSGGAGKGVGVARVGDHRPGPPAGKHPAAPVHGCRRATRAGERPGNRRARRKLRHKQVSRVGLLQAARDTGQRDSGDGGHGREPVGSER